MTLQWHDVFLMVIPFLISVITKPEWPGSVKYVIAIAFCFLAAIGEFYLSVWMVNGAQGSFTAAFAKSFLVIFGTYAGIWKPSGYADRVETKING